MNSAQAKSGLPKGGVAMNGRSTDSKQKYCSVCGEPATDTICQSCKAKIQGEAARRKQQIEREVKTDTNRKQPHIIAEPRRQSEIELKVSRIEG
jgi:hypothetical protein